MPGLNIQTIILTLLVLLIFPHQEVISEVEAGQRLEAIELPDKARVTEDSGSGQIGYSRAVDEPSGVIQAAREDGIAKSPILLVPMVLAALALVAVSRRKERK